MKLTTYVDYTLMPSYRSSTDEVANAASELMRTLHSGFKLYPNEFFLGFPNIDQKNMSQRFKVFRVFSESLENQTKLFEFIKNSSGFEKKFFAHFPKSVPSDFNGEYRAFFRDRIKSRDRADERYRKMNDLMNSNAPWIDMYSSTNKNSFRMYISFITSDTPKNGKVNSYGLSLKDEPVYLPNIRN